MAEPWPILLTPTGWWQVHYGDGPDDFVSFPPEREREARMMAAAPLLRQGCLSAGKLTDALRFGYVPDPIAVANGIAADLARALAACEPIRQGESHD